MITIVIFILCAIYGVFSSPLNLEVFERQSPPIESGGLIFETSNTPGVNCINGPGGEFSVTWENPSSLFICGKGWNPGSARYACRGKKYFKSTIECLHYPLEASPTPEQLMLQEMLMLGSTAGPLILLSNTILSNCLMVIIQDLGWWK